jgi:hypothetical protein
LDHECQSSQAALDERIRLVEDLWESIAADQRSLVLTQEQKEELDRRTLISSWQQSCTEVDILVVGKFVLKQGDDCRTARNSTLPLSSPYGFRIHDLSQPSLREES